MSQHRLIDRARSQRRMVHALLERHALIRRTDTGARMLRALDASDARVVSALSRYFSPAEVQISPIDAQYEAVPPAVSADAPFFAPSLSAAAQPASALPPLPLPERTTVSARLPEALEPTVRATDAALQSFAEVPPSAPVIAPSVTPAASAPPVGAITSDALPAASTASSIIDQSAPLAAASDAPLVAAAPDAPPAPPGESTRAPALPLPDAPRPRRLARVVQEGAAPGERPATPVRPSEAESSTLADTAAATESAAPQSNARRSMDAAPRNARSEPASAQTPHAARTPQEIAKLLFGDRGGASSAQPETLDAAQPAGGAQPLQARSAPAGAPPADALPSVAERLRMFQSEVAAVRSASATSSELFHPQDQPRTPQDWVHLLGEATNPRGQGSGVRDQEAKVRTTDDRRPTTDDRRSLTTLPPLPRRFVRPLVSLEPSTVIVPDSSTAADLSVADAHVDNRLVTAEDTLSTEQSLPADVREQTSDVEDMPVARFDSTVSPGAPAPARPAPVASPASELVAPTNAERTSQEWARLLAQATNPQIRGQGAGVRGQSSGTNIPERPLSSAATAASTPSAFRGQEAREAVPNATRNTQNAVPNTQHFPTGSTERGQRSADKDQQVGSASQPAARSPQPAALSPLRETTRRFLRPLVGIDPDSVRVHRGPLADQVASAYAADAVTMGDDVLLAAGHEEESPETIGLLAHELTHAARAREPRFVPPLVRGALQATGDEEPLARAVETRVRNAVPDAAQPDTPFRAFHTAAPGTAQPRVRTPEEQTRWGDLPAPWEPLTDWLAPPNADRPTPTAQRRPPNADRPTPTANMGAAARSTAPAAPAIDTATSAVAAPAMRAEQGRSLDGEQPAAPAAPAAAPPEADLDALARQVYNVLKQRLVAERRRIG